MQEAKAKEEKRRVQVEEREHKMIVALKETRPLVETVKLPTMEKGMDIEAFLELFETALTVAKISEAKWITRLHTTLDSETKLLVREIFVNPDSTFEEAKAALTGQTHMSFSAASEAMMTLDEGKVTRMPIRQGAQRVANFLKKACEQALTWGETHLYGAVAIMRYHMHSEVKTYLDLKGVEKPDDCFRAVEEWKRTHPGKSVWDLRPKGIFDRQSYRTGNNTNRRQGEWFACGKMGHYASERRSKPIRDGPRVSTEKTVQPDPKRDQGAERPNEKRGLGDVTCYNCRQKGHIAPNCPKRADKVRKVRVLEEHIVCLRRNEVFGSVGPHRMPVTCDTSADITVVPDECVEPHQKTGKQCVLRSFKDLKTTGDCCEVVIAVGDVSFKKQAVT